MILRNLQIQRRRAFPRASRNVIMRSMARTKPASIITCFADWNAAEMRADACIIVSIPCTQSLPRYRHTQHNQPLGLLDPIFIWLWITEGLPVYFVGFVDLVLCPVADEDGLAAPFDDYLHSPQLHLPDDMKGYE